MGRVSSFHSVEMKTIGFYSYYLKKKGQLCEARTGAYKCGVFYTVNVRCKKDFR